MVPNHRAESEPSCLRVHVSSRAECRHTQPKQHHRRQYTIRYLVEFVQSKALLDFLRQNDANSSGTMLPVPHIRVVEGDSVPIAHE
jgi:hypothetical protein